VSNDSHSSDSEIICNVEETYEIIESVPEISPQPIDRHDTIDTHHNSSEPTPPSVPEVVVELVQEVSFPSTNAAKKVQRERQKQNWQEKEIS
jgi:hypothetical protein